MANVYGRITKITNAVGRSKYITDIDRQEEIVLHKMNMQYSWEEHSSFEKNNQKTNVANNEALEVVVALPNELSLDKEKLEAVCDDLAKAIVDENKDYEYAVHWNKARTNLHLHLLFSERENQTELTPKVYKRDIWQDKDTHKLAKANAENAELVYRKGDIQRDKEGNIKYETDIFKPKDTLFKDKDFAEVLRGLTQIVFKKYGYDLGNTTKDSPYLAQKKLYKGASKDYLDEAKAWNEEAKKHNDKVKEHIYIDPYQLDNYKARKREIMAKVKEANSKEKKITPRAIEIVKEATLWIQEALDKLYAFFLKYKDQFYARKMDQEVEDNYDNDLDYDDYEEKKDYNDDDIEILM